MGDEPVGGAENIGCAAVVVFELDDLGRGIVPLEFQDVADACAPPAVDRLIRVARHRDFGQLRAARLVKDAHGVIMAAGDQQVVAMGDRQHTVRPRQLADSSHRARARRVNHQHIGAMGDQQAAMRAIPAGKIPAGIGRGDGAG